MAEQHLIAGPARGEPLPAGSIGARIRVPLSGTPSSHWSELLGAALTTRLLGHPAANRLRLNRVVQGGELVLENVQALDTEYLGAALREAVDAANAGMRRAERPPPPFNMDQAEANRIATALGLQDARPLLEVRAYAPRP